MTNQKENERKKRLFVDKKRLFFDKKRLFFDKKRQTLSL